MASTINHLVLNPPAPSVEANQSIPLMVTAVNSTGAIVLLSPGKLQWSSDNHTYATVDTSGVVVGIADGSANITVTDTESLKSVSTKVTVTPAPISWWKAEGNALDAEGLNNGTVSGGVSYTTGHLGQAFWFNGTDGVINMGDPSSLALTGSLTIDAWVYPLSIPSASQVGAEILMRADDRDALDPYYLCINSDGNYYFQVCNAANTNAIVKAAATLNVWQHVTATLDNTTGDMRLYINGQVAAETTTTVRPFQNLDTIAPHGVAIGNSPGAGTVWHYPFNGYIDELKIYNVVAPPGG